MYHFTVITSNVIMQVLKVKITVTAEYSGLDRKVSGQ